GMTLPNIMNNEPIDITADFSQFTEKEKDAVTETEENKITVDNIANAPTVDEAIAASQAGIDEALSGKELEGEIIADEAVEFESYLKETIARKPIVMQPKVPRPEVKTKGYTGEVSKRVRPIDRPIARPKPLMPKPEQPIVEPTKVKQPVKEQKIIGESEGIATQLSSPVEERARVEKMVAKKTFVPASMLKKYPGIVKTEDILEKKPEVKVTEPVKKVTVPKVVKEEVITPDPLRANETVVKTMVVNFNNANHDAKLKFDGITTMPKIMQDKPDQYNFTYSIKIFIANKTKHNHILVWF
ncbi:unnamed protein product, partial [marine sediment metagenome]